MSSYRFVVLGMPEACTLEVVLTLRECMCAALQMAERSMISELAVHEYVDSLGSSPEQLSVSFWKFWCHHEYEHSCISFEDMVCIYQSSI